jgi:hypothetical protein
LAPQALEKAQTPPENGVAPYASDPQDAAPIRDEVSASGLETPAQESFALDAPPMDRPESNCSAPCSRSFGGIDSGIVL